MLWLALFTVLEAAAPATAAPVAITRPLAAGSILSPDDIRSGGADEDGYVGKELRRYMPAGALVHQTDLRTPTLVARNRQVRLEFLKGSLSITAEGRALSNGAAGDTVRVLNLSSKTVITGVVVDLNRVEVR